MYTFDNINNANNVGTTLTVQLNSATGPTGTITVASAAVFSPITVPFLLVLGPVGEVDPSTVTVEVLRIDTVNTGSNTLHFSDRSLDGTPATTWPVGSTATTRVIGAYITQMQTDINDMAGATDAAKVSAYLNFGDKYR